ncbi:MAG: MFS transporter [Rhodospirillaceae bacterium]
MDASSEMIHAVLPAFLVVGLGVSTVTVGLIEGIAEATAAIFKIFSGTLSDRLGHRKALTIAGYGLSASTKPLFALAYGVAPVLLARFLDRVGKGIRGAPRDALIADITPTAQRGAAYGLRQALDTVGALLGPLFAIAVMLITGNDFRWVFWLAVLPAVLAVAVLAAGVRETVTVAPRPDLPLVALGPQTWKVLGPRFGVTVALATVLTLAGFSEAFLLLRAADTGFGLTWAPIVMVVMNATYAVSAYPAGRLSDIWGRRGLLVAGALVLAAADLVIGFADGAVGVLIGSALWGVHAGLTKGLLSALVADAAPPERRGTAFGLFNLVTGAALLVASVLAGVLWSAFGAQATFLAGAGFALAAALGFKVSNGTK